LATKFPSDVSYLPNLYASSDGNLSPDLQISLTFTYDLPFPTFYSFTGESSIALPSLTYERASVLFNVAALYASIAASERRAEAEGIKRALGYLSVCLARLH